MSTMRKLRRTIQGPQYKVEPFRQEERLPGRKMSEVLLDFAEPLLDALDDDDEFKGAISFAAICWNLSFLPEKTQRKQLRSIGHQLGGSDALSTSEIEYFARILLERKKAFFADDRRMVADYEVVNEEEGDSLLVASTLVHD